jgi:hypothetical protein
MNLEQFRLPDMHILALGHLCAVMAVLGLALLAGAQLLEGQAARLRVLAVGDLWRHAALGEGAARMTGVDKEGRRIEPAAVAGHGRAGLALGDNGLFSIAAEETGHGFSDRRIEPALHAAVSGAPPASAACVPPRKISL